MQPSDEAQPKSKSRRLTYISIIVALILIGGAVYARSRSAQPQTKAVTSASQKAFTLEELVANNGKDGRKCYVAVDGKVYEIEQGRLWKNGEHVTSKGQAHCGKDLSETIGKSPHGKSKLEALPTVGTLE
jgi:predicted heme/steroid binding protein